ncbi:MAG TPA: TolC family protein [Gammaproteobacteria bacterium]|jgi:outer membrane protein TolC|nr:TolC family protein [Gammaproteobacteria bacterium]
MCHKRQSSGSRWPGLLFFLCFFFCNVSDANNHHLVKKRDPLSLSLEDAILLAVRSHPNVKTAQLQHVMQKFELYVQQWQFYPHYTLEASAIYTRSNTSLQPIVGSNNYNVQPAVSWVSPIGTQATLSSSIPKTNLNPNLSLQVMQPLLRGFGKAVVQAALNNARDAEVVARLNVEQVLRSTVSAVIQAYLDVVAAERSITIDADALKRATLSLHQTKLLIKAGHKAGAEIITAQANVASANTQLQNDNNRLLQARYALLAAIGLDPNTEMTFTRLDLNDIVHQYHVPSLGVAKETTLANDIQYQVDNMTLHGASTRALLVAEDNTRWQLNLTGSVATSTGSTIDPDSQNNANNALSGKNQAQSVGLTLQIPIDDQLAKQAVFNAKIALREADLALKEEKWNKETDAINGWHSVNSALLALKYARDAESLQKKNYDLNYQKYVHGLIDSIELQSTQTQLIQAQQTLLMADLNYIRALVGLDLLMGHTLKTWHVGVRLS